MKTLSPDDVTPNAARDLPFSNVAQFARWFMSVSLGECRPPREAFSYYRFTHGFALGIVLFRQPPFQVELFIAPPDTEIPSHKHPNVDSIEVHLCGDTGFVVRGHRLTKENLAKVAIDGASAFCGFKFRVRPSDDHGAHIGPAGGAFLSVQHWLDGVAPSSVGMNWDGPAHETSAVGNSTATEPHRKPL